MEKITSRYFLAKNSHGKEIVFFVMLRACLLTLYRNPLVALTLMIFPEDMNLLQAFKLYFPIHLPKKSFFFKSQKIYH